jgi:Mrp family chromosome partitioning ATPase
MDQDLDAKFQLLRARIEADLQPGTVVLVTSALPGDGKSVTAHGLANCFARAGRRVALAGRELVPMGPPSHSNAVRNVVRMALPFDESGAGELGTSVARFVREMRETYDFTIVDGEPFSRGAASSLLAGTVDGVLLTVRLGRAQQEHDELMIQTLDHAKAAVLGVVAVSGEAIDAFRSPQSKQRADQRRHVPTEPREGSVVASTSVAR